MKNQTKVAELAVHNWYATYSQYCDKFGKKTEFELEELDIVGTKSKGRDLYIFTSATLDRHIVTELRGYTLDGILYPAECYTRRELGHSIPESQWHLVKYKPVVALENRLAYHAKNHEISEYYRISRAIIRFAGSVTRVLDGKSYTVTPICKDTYLVISPEVVQINDEISEGFCPEYLNRAHNDSIVLKSDISPLNRRENKLYGKPQLVREQKRHYFVTDPGPGSR